MIKGIKIGCVAVAALAIQACAPSSYVVQDPTPSSLPYLAQSTAETTITINDKRPDDGRVFSYGVLKAGLVQNGSEIDPIGYLTTHTQTELNARALNAAIADAGETQVDIRKLTMRNHRTNAYTPFITLTMLSADLQANGKTERIAAFIKRGKTPVWTFDEIVQPTLNEPLDLLVKEFAAKLSSRLFAARIPDDEVSSLVAKIKAGPVGDSTYLDVYQLGFGNNPAAVPALAELARHESEYVRLAAISSLGILRAEDQLDLLKSIYHDNRVWQDRGMALKAIGDIGSPDALAFLEQARKDLGNQTEREVAWNQEIIQLYLN